MVDEKSAYFDSFNTTIVRVAMCVPAGARASAVVRSLTCLWSGGDDLVGPDAQPALAGLLLTIQNMIHELKHLHANNDKWCIPLW